MNKQKGLKIASSPDEMYRVEQYVEMISDEHLLYGNYYSNILMAVSEAVQNAMLHGNRMDTGKFVRISEECTKEGLWIRVLDEGDGFDHAEYSAVNDLMKDFNTHADGLYLIHKLADDVRFQQGGRQIEMLFRINGIEDNIFQRRITFLHDFFRVYQRLNT